MAVQVFVYGTLLVGEANHDLLGGAAFVSEGATPPDFELRDLGGYPALVQGGSVAVPGEVYEVDEEQLLELDRFEDHPRLYVRKGIVLADGRRVETYVMSAPQAAGAPVIESGSWRQRQEEVRRAAPARRD